MLNERCLIQQATTSLSKSLMTLPSSYNPTRLVSAQSAVNGAVPDISSLTSLYKAELAVNTYTARQDLVASAAGIYVRVGDATIEDADDSLIRIGPAFVTDDVVTTTEPGITFTGVSASKLKLAGQIWHRRTDQQTFLYDSNTWVKLTAASATEDEAGLIELATEAEALLGVSTTTAITPSTLESWSVANNFLRGTDSLLRLYVDAFTGNDSIGNKGLTKYTAFRTIERAAIETARVALATGNTSLDNFCTITVAAADYIIDNRPGVAVFSSLNVAATGATGPVNPLNLNIKVVTYNPLTSVLTTTATLATQVKPGDEIYTTAGGRAVIVSISALTAVLKDVTGLFISPNDLLIAQHYLFNSPTGGITLPRGTSLIGDDLRKTVVRPLYIGDLAEALDDTGCLGTGRTYMLGVTGGCYIQNLTFKDNLSFKFTHHTCTAIAYATELSLTNASYGYYRKIFYALSNLSTLTLVGNGSLISEYQIVGNAASRTTTDADGFPVVDTVIGKSPYVFSCSLLSRFGMQGMLVDGAAVSGFKSMVAAQFTNVSLQVDPDAYTSDANVPGGRRYISSFWKHKSFSAFNGGYAQLVSCFVIGSARQFYVASGGEFSITNSCSNFGDESLVADGFSEVILPQDTGATCSKIIAPRPIPATPVRIPTLPFVAANSTSTRIYVDGDITNDRILPFTYQPGDTISVDIGTLYTATLASSGPLFGSDVDGFYYITSATANGIFANAAILDGFSIELTRTPDNREADNRIYWLKVEGLTSSTVRPPQINSVLRLDILQNSVQLQTTLFVADVKSTDFNGAALPNGTYYVAILQGTGLNDRLDLIFPDIITDSPLENPAQSLTYKSVDSLLQNVGLTLGQRAALLVVSTGETTIPITLYLQFARPSLIRASNHTWEWAGYGNYNSALPKFQDKVFTVLEASARIKVETNGGRVYNVGMDQDGNYYVGDTILDLKTGKQINKFNPAADSVTFDNVNVRKRLLMFPNSTLDLRSAIIGIDSLTRFSNNITPNYASYATTEKAGFTELATLEEARIGVDPSRVITPSVLVGFSSILARSITNCRISVTTQSPLVQNLGGVFLSNSLWLHPYGGNEIGLYDLALESWIATTVSASGNPVSFNVSTIGGTTANTNYDVYIYNAGSITNPDVRLQLIAWINDTTPADRFRLQGVLVNNSDRSKRLIGAVRTSIAGRVDVDLGGIRTPSEDPARCMIANLYNTREVSLFMSFTHYWIATGQNSYTQPPGYGVSGRCNFIHAEENIVTAVASIYSSFPPTGGPAATGPNLDYQVAFGAPSVDGGSGPNVGTAYVNIGLGGTPVSSPVSLQAETSSASSVVKSYYSQILNGYQSVSYMYKVTGDYSALINKHSGSTGMIVTIKV